MSTSDDISLAYRDAFDALRQEIGPEGPLQLFEKKAGVQDAVLLSLESGWKSEGERRFGEVESTFVVSIVEQEEVTPEIMSKAARILVGDVLCSIENWEAPHEAPRLWTVFAKEIKPGGVRR